MNNLSYLAKIIKVEGNRLTLELKDELNIERLKTIFDGYDGERQAEIFIKDPRGFTVEQRKFFFALLNDIYKETGLSIDEMKDYIYSMARRFCYTRFIRVHCFRCNQQTFQPSWTGRDVLIFSRRTIYGIP